MSWNSWGITIYRAVYYCLFSHPYKERTSLSAALYLSNKHKGTRRGRHEETKRRRRSRVLFFFFFFPAVDLWSRLAGSHSTSRCHWSLKSAHALFTGLCTELFYWKWVSHNLVKMPAGVFMSLICRLSQQLSQLEPRPFMWRVPWPFVSNT